MAFRQLGKLLLDETRPLSPEVTIPKSERNFYSDPA